MSGPTLYVFAGLPGTGKTTLARLLARDRSAVYLRIDTIEQTLCESNALVDGTEGYRVAFRLAGDNLRLGSPVVADSVNPVAASRTAWHGVADACGARVIDIEVVCSDPVEHRTRVEARVVDVPGLSGPTWEQIRAREYAAWAWPIVRVDTAGRDIADSAVDLLARLSSR